MTSRLYTPADVKNMPTIQTPTRRVKIRVVARKPTTNRSLSMNANAVSTPTVIFCGSPYNLRLQRSEMIGMDLDGTLAYSMRPYDPRRIGPPVIPMCRTVMQWLKQGKKVIILTARLNSKEHTPAQIQYTHKLISAWTKKYVGKALPSTSEKHHLMTVIYDDRARQVIPNTGKIVKCGKN